jgi:RNA polymerase sigma factor (sigma-70 family)
MAARQTLFQTEVRQVEEDLHAATDQQLEIRAASGDRDAFGVLYERYCDRVYDFLLRMVRNHDEAADIMQETFVRAMKALSGERAGAAAFSTWLFTIARNLALTRLGRGKRTVPLVEEEEEGAEQQRVYQLVDPDTLADPQEATQAKEMANLVWQAAAALNPKEYSILDLHVRQGLDSAEISEVLGVSKGNARTMLSRVKDAFEDAFTSLVMFQHGRRRCEVLDRLIAEERSEGFSTPIRKLIARHASECVVCQEQRRRLVSAESVLRSLVPLPLPLLLKRKIAEAATQGWPSPTGGVAGASRAGGSALRTAARTAAGKAAASIGGWKALVLWAVLLVAGGGVAGLITTRVAGSGPRHDDNGSVQVNGGQGTKDTIATGGTTMAQPDPTPFHQAAGATILPTPPKAPSLPPTAVPAIATPAPIVSPPSLIPTAVVPTAVPAAPTAAPAPTCGAPQPVVLGPASADDSYASAMLDLSNQYRSQRGLPALAVDGRLNSAAAEHAKFVAETQWWTKMQGSQIHYGPDCRDMYDRAIANGYPPAWIGENVMWGSVGLAPSDLFNIMLNSVHEDPANTIFAYTGIACFVRSSTSPAEFACVQVYASVPQ